MPNLKSFLKDGEVESYRNVEVSFVPGKKAIMTIYEGESMSAVGVDGMEEKEKIVLSDYKTKEEMHALMIEKGFQLKSEEELEAMKIRKQKEAAEEAERKAKRKEEMRIKREMKQAQKKLEEEEKEKAREEMEGKGEEGEGVADIEKEQTIDQGNKVENEELCCAAADRAQLWSEVRLNKMRKEFRDIFRSTCTSDA
eukprot:CAMPEP_0181124710 /NCGR_PEP_ID=MMETSP1071-20121207/26635_1 /TAXON_ID=35127 /ORGANISM="Thalassiosira sp., Strain NH16" /LENGTH=196 /DNA_ID=CAMNT_0023210051 /DNA_START=152 /DNA_END=743 /DNA_ORIENTATION=+